MHLVRTVIKGGFGCDIVVVSIGAGQNQGCLTGGVILHILSVGIKHFIRRGGKSDVADGEGGEVFVGRDYQRTQSYSSEIAAKIDSEIMVRECVDKEK